MHGAGEIFAFYGFIVTVAIAFAIRWALSSRSAPILLLVALWPVILILFIEGAAAFQKPYWWGFYVYLGVMAAATLLGALTSDVVRWSRNRRNSPR